ncbi:MAG: SDR family NAD(P)-dependent oxidoreductase [Alphaproteobacteria bacterium]|nr:SDR family NAD(P)-dependent oxidoreductase [Alphaproteobacteria bacterium]
MSEISTILITGGAGFIGSSLADKLLALGHRVIVFDNFNDYYDPAIKQKNVEQALQNKNYALYKGDIESMDDLEKVFSQNKMDAIVHLAARAGVRPSIEAPLAYAMTNIIGTINILEMMKKYNVKRMSMASSSSVYGNCKADKFSEDLNIREPISPYAATKSADEQICYTYHHLYGLEIYMLRFFTVFGPRQRPDLAINKFTNLIMNDKPIDMYGDGSTMRDYTYIDDITDGIVASLNYHQTGYEIFNLGGGSPVTLKQMIETIEDVLGKKATINQLPMQPGDVDKTISDISKAQNLLGYHPHTSFKEGIRKFIAWKMG